MYKPTVGSNWEIPPQIGVALFHGSKWLPPIVCFNNFVNIAALMQRKYRGIT